MKILQVHPSLRLVGGLPAYAASLTAFLESCPGMEVGHVDETEAKGYATILGTQPVSNLIQGSARLRSALARQLKTFRPDLVHLHSAHGKSLVEKTALAWFARRSGARVVLHLHGPDLADEIAGKRAVLAWLYRAVWGDPGVRVVVLSEGAHQFLRREMPAVQVVRLSNGVEVNPAPTPLRCAPVRIGFLGVMNGFKGELDLVEAIGRKESQSCELLMAGDGPTREAVERRVKALHLEDRVKLLGTIEGEAKERFFEEIDVLCLPSRRDNLPIAILEAMAQARPVIASKVGGIPELVDDGVTGWLVEPGDVRNLAETIGRAVAAPEELKARGQRGWEKASRHYDWRVVGPQVVKLYQDLCAEPAAAAKPE